MAGKAVGRVLIVGDDSRSCSLLQQRLTNLSWQTVVIGEDEVHSTVLAWEKFDLIILDSARSDPAGSETINRIRKLAPQAGIAVITDSACKESEPRPSTHKADYSLERSLGERSLSDRSVDDRSVDPEQLHELLIRVRERRRLFGAMEREQSRYQRLIDDVPIGVCEIDVENSAITYVNRYLLDLGGYAKEDVVGRPAEEFVIAEEKERFLSRLSARIDGFIDPIEPSTVYTFHKKDGGTVKAMVLSRSIETTSGRMIEGVVYDVTAEQRLAQLQRTVLSLGEAILAEEDIDRILQLVLDGITEHGGFQRAAVSLYDLSVAEPLSGMVYKILASGLSEEEIDALRSRAGMSPQERGMAFAERFKLGPAYYIPHDQTPWDPNLGLNGTVTVDGWHKNDFLFFPLKGEKGIIGHISVDDPLDRDAPTEASLAPVATLVNFAALAVERIYKLVQLRKQKDRLHDLSEFSRRLARTQTVKALCSFAADHLQRDMGCDLCAIRLKDGAEISLEGISAQRDLPGEEVPERKTRIPLTGKGLARWVIEHQEPVIVPDVRKDGRYKESVATTRSAADVPIIGQKGALGSISVESRKLAAFDAQDIEILTTVAGQLSVALSNLRRRESLARIHALGHRLVAATDVDTLIDGVIAFLAEEFDYEHSAVLLREGDELVMGGIKVISGQTNFPVGSRFKFSDGIVGWVAANKEYALVNDVSTDPRYIESFVDIRAELAVPVMIAGRLLGIVDVGSLQKDFFDEEDRQLIEAIADVSAIALSNLAAQDQLREQAVRDPLTNLYNRYYFNEAIRLEIDRADRYDHPISLMMIDVDGFRAVNNRLGHIKGDEVLRAVAQVIEKSVRTVDRVIRYGGDEFLILMPETAGRVDEVVQRLKERIAKLSHDLRLGEFSIGLSIGSCTREPRTERSIEEILEEADKSMYADKRAAHADKSAGYQYR